MGSDLPTRGQLRAATLPRLVRNLWKARGSGILHLSSGLTQKRLFFKKGDIVFAGTNLEQERLGERLVRAGKITRPGLDLACRVMERSEQRFGTILVELGWLSASEMQAWVAEQIRDIVKSVFTWSHGEYRFEPSEEPIEPDLMLQVRTAEVVWEGLRRSCDWDAIREEVGESSRVPRLVNGDRLTIPISQEEGFILSRVDGQRSVAEILASSPRDEDDTLRRIYALVLANILELEDAPVVADDPVGVDEDELDDEQDEPDGGDAGMVESEQAFRDGITARIAAMKLGNLYDRLGVETTAPLEEIEQAFRSVLESIEPAAEHRAGLEDLSADLKAIRGKVEEAHRVLTDPRSRRAYDLSLTGASPASLDESAAAASSGGGPRETGARTSPASPAGVASDTLPPQRDRDPRTAERHYRQAKRHLDEGDYFDAIAAVDQAIRSDPEAGKYHRFLAELLSENPDCLKTAEEHFQRSLELDPEDRDAYQGLAALYQRLGRDDQVEELQARIRVKG